MYTTTDIVIPVHNTLHITKKCIPLLTSLIDEANEQSNIKFDITVIDDGSTDDTAEVVTLLREEGWHFEYQYQPNAGVSAVRNRGVREAAYEWLIFLDADDELLPGALRQFRDALEGESEKAD